jgi:hypothetical protein
MRGWLAFRRSARHVHASITLQADMIVDDAMLDYDWRRNRSSKSPEPD